MSEKKCNTNRKNKHLNFTERELIEKWLKEKVNKTEIAKRLGRDRVTIYREIKRGTTIQVKGTKTIEVYLADTGQAVYEKNRQNSYPKKKARFSNRFFYMIEKAKFHGKFTGKEREYNIKTFVLQYKKENPREKVPTFKTVYRYIREGELKIRPHDLPLMYRLGPRKNQGSKPKGSNKKKLGRSISERPDDVLERKDFGHWEADLVKGKRTKGEPAIITLVERKTRYAITRKIKDYKSETVRASIEKVIKDHSLLFQSITFDNGAEFSKVHQLETDSLDIYFAHAYSSWERGSNENFNGLLREFVEKGKSIHHFSKEYIQYATRTINQRKRAILNCLSAKEHFKEESFELKVS